MVTIPHILKDIAKIFSNNGKSVYLVGGAVRDMLRGGEGKDLDLATDALPEDVTAMFHAAKCRVIPTGIKHGTVTVVFQGNPFEITTFRTESDYGDGRHPEKVAFARTIEEDLSRRDFTMNAIALELPSGRVVDPFGGSVDIKNRLVRCVGSPLERFGEDGLRPLRCVRFAAQLGFAVDSDTLAAIQPSLSITEKVSAERKRDELDKILAAKGAINGLRLMEKTGLLALILPEVAACRNVDQKGFHRFDVLDHSLLACGYAATEEYPREVCLAALLHDIGKPATRKKGEDGVWTFYRHEQESERLARDILTRLRYPNAVIDTVCLLVACHMFHYTDDWTDAAVRRFVMRVGEGHLPNLYRLRRCDAFATVSEPLPHTFLMPLIDRVNAILAQKRALSLKDLAVSGSDLIALGITPGPRLGVILNELLETVIDDPELNVKEKLLEIARNMEAR
jgi:putative nucleotidyltransferase with HDIG domain